MYHMTLKAVFFSSFQTHAFTVRWFCKRQDFPIKIYDAIMIWCRALYIFCVCCIGHCIMLQFSEKLIKIAYHVAHLLWQLLYSNWQHNGTKGMIFLHYFTYRHQYSWRSDPIYYGLILISLHLYHHHIII